ncbi:hypothetical protein CPAV1605_196 [seawater metagenome]|uniref:Flavin-binding monooxygenase-like n=1 Tax=seawater metagenome TaxID=1561972 RepID=A0A5E8CIH2_9ZZZZ
MTKNILIIGAGPAGLAFIMAVYKHNFNYTLTCYEKEDKIGGIWSKEAEEIKINDNMYYDNFGRYKLDDNQIYKFGDYEIKNENKNIWLTKDVQVFLNNICELTKINISFNKKVIQIKPLKEGFNIEYIDLSDKFSKIHISHFDIVINCSGPHAVFSDKIINTSDFKGPVLNYHKNNILKELNNSIEKLKDKSILIIGMSFPCLDILNLFKYYKIMFKKVYISDYCKAFDFDDSRINYFGEIKKIKKDTVYFSNNICKIDLIINTIGLSADSTIYPEKYQFYKGMICHNVENLYSLANPGPLYCGFNSIYIRATYIVNVINGNIKLANEKDKLIEIKNLENKLKELSYKKYNDRINFLIEYYENLINDINKKNKLKDINIEKMLNSYDLLNYLNKNYINQ